MKKFWLLIVVLLCGGACGDGDRNDNRVCTLDLDQICTDNQEDMDDEVAAGSVDCLVVGGDLYLCADPIDVDAVISVEGKVGDAFARGPVYMLDRFETLE